MTTKPKPPSRVKIRVSTDDKSVEIEGPITAIEAMGDSAARLAQALRETSKKTEERGT